MLTKKQHQLLMFIDHKLRETGISPSFDEMKEALDLKSKSGIHRLITALEERGFIRRLPHRARALEVLRLPEGNTGPVGIVPVSPGPVTSPPASFGAGTPSGTASSGIQTNIDTETVVRAKFGSQPRALPDDLLSLPLAGKIAAGTPIEALQDTSTLVEVPASMVGRGTHYCLTIEGDSMIEAGILNGDLVVIRECETAENGTIVVALVDGHEATLKRLRRKGENVALEPANRQYETRIFGPDRVQVQGRLVGLLRRYN